MDRTTNIIAGTAFLVIGLMLMVFASGSEKWFTGLTFMLIGGVLLRRVVKSKTDNDEIYTVIKERAFTDNPTEGALIYFLMYYGGLSLFYKARELWGYAELESWGLYVMSFSMVLITLVDQRSKARKKALADKELPSQRATMSEAGE